VGADTGVGVGVAVRVAVGAGVVVAVDVGAAVAVGLGVDVLAEIEELDASRSASRGTEQPVRAAAARPVAASAVAPACRLIRRTAPILAPQVPFSQRPSP
jgi:hypothetical protein